jgi:tRNA pseudouridine38-40 synthase
VGRHDFQNFCGLSQTELKKINSVRTITSFQVVRNQKGKIVFTIQGPGFLRYQIRMMIGAIYKVIQNKKYQPADLKNLLTNPGQKKIGFVAPAQGLLLKEIILKKND